MRHVLTLVSFPSVRTGAILAIGLGVSLVTVAGSPTEAQSAKVGRITIDALIDIKHPSNPVWSRDSRSVAFMWERAGVSNLFVVPADGSAKPVAITKDGRQVAGVTWGWDSKALYFTTGGTLMKVIPDGAHAPEPAQFPGRGATFSPDGTRIAYLGAGSAPGTEIRVRSLVDGGDRVVATFAGAAGGVTWTTDGKRLTFTSGGGRGQSIRHEQTPDYSGSKIIYTVTENVAGPAADSYVVAETGGAPLKINTGGGGGGRGGGNRWIDTTRMVVDRQAPDFKRRSIFVVNTTTGDQTLLHEDVKTTFWSMVGGAAGGSQASPDGKWISFLSDRDGWDHLFVAPAGWRHS